MSREHLARIAVAAVAIPIIVWICYQGGWWLWGMIALFAGVATGEFLWAEGWRPRHVVFWLAWVPYCGAMLWLASFMDLYWDRASGLALKAYAFRSFWVVLVMQLVLAAVFAMGRSDPAKLFRGYARLAWGTFYIAVLYTLVYFVHFYGEGFVESGGDLLIFLFAILWIGDTAAMYVGRAFGKRKLAPTVSPNKTVEGLVGGLIAAALVGAVFYYWKLDELPMYHVLIIAFGASLFGQMGDLVESMWKRSLGIKDSSSIIPGHGGVLDRFDSLLFAAPFVVVYLELFRPYAGP